MGDPWTQKKISQLEAKAIIEDRILEQVAAALGVSVDEIKEFSDPAVVNNVQNIYDTATGNQGPNAYHNCTFNPLDKLVEAYEEIKRLNAELIKEKDEKIALLTKVMNERSEIWTTSPERRSDHYEVK